MPLIYMELYRVRDDIQFHSFTCGFPIFLELFVEETLSPLCIFHIFVKN